MPETVSPQLRLEYVLLSQAIEWDWVDNAKQHDVGGLCESIRRYGFRDPPELDSTLGAFAQGNGRVKALAWMYRQNPDDRPRYVAQAKDGEWAVPVLFGADSDSSAIAQAYALDANNLVVTGADSNIWDMLRLYDKMQMAEILECLAAAEQELVTLDADAMNYAGRRDEEKPLRQPDEVVRWSFVIEFEDQQELLQEMEDLLGPYFKPYSKRKLLPTFFVEMVRSRCNMERGVLWDNL